MPELPEVETTKRGLERLILTRRIIDCVVRNPHLRWKVPDDIGDLLRNATILSLTRRAKYLLLNTSHGSLLLHLGMSGSIRVVATDTPVNPHDHVDIVLDNGSLLRYRDPRRFGLMLWAGDHPLQHPLLSKLGPEPLCDEFNSDYLYRISRKRKTSIKQLLMDSQVVSGIGNIYANEALFMSAIRPAKRAAGLTRVASQTLCQAIKQVLLNAIAAGGSSLRDFTHADGNPGYFQQQLFVYGREGEPCQQCGHAIKSKRIGQRSSFYCPQCQH